MRGDRGKVGGTEVERGDGGWEMMRHREQGDSAVCVCVCVCVDLCVKLCVEVYEFVYKCVSVRRIVCMHACVRALILLMN